MAYNGPLKNHEGIVSTRYVGPNPRLSEKAALVRSTSNPEVVEAQFNDTGTGMGQGWHALPRVEFFTWSPKV